MDTASELLERGPELDTLNEVVKRAGAGGEGGFVLVEGGAGVGKTTLLAEAARLARESGFIVLGARAQQLERDLTLGVLHRVFDAAPDDSPEVPVMRQATHDWLTAPPEQLDPIYGIAHMLVSEVEVFLEQVPIMVVMDDGHWADRASLRILHLIATRTEGRPLILLLGTRVDEPNAAPELELLRETANIVLRPQQLSPHASASLVEAKAEVPLPADVVQAIVTAGGGNPFLTVELVAALTGDGHPVSAAAVSATLPDSVAASVRSRLRRHSDAAQRVARAVSVLGDQPPTHHVAALTDLDVDAVMAAGTELSRASIFGARRPLSFAHPLIATAVRGDLDPHEEALAHARAVAVLRTDGAGPPEVATHLLHSQPAGDPLASGDLRAAAALALARGSADSAVQLLGRALAEPPPRADRGAVLAELGAAELADGRASDAVVHLTDGLGLASTPAELAERAIALAGAHTTATGMGAAVEVLDDAAARLPDEEEELRLTLTAHAIQMCLFDANLYGRGWDRLARIEPPSGDTEAGRAVLSMHALRAVFFGGTASEAAGFARAAMANGRLRTDTGMDAVPFGYAIVAAVHAGELVLAADELAAARRLAAERGSPSTLAVLGASQATYDDRVGDLRQLAETIAVARMALAADPDSRVAAVMNGYYAATEALTHAEAGDGAAADAALAAGGLLDDIGHDQNSLRMIWWRTRTHLALGRLAEADADLERLAAWHVQTRVDWDPSTPWRALRARVAAVDGRTELACALAEEELARAYHWGTPYAIGVALMARGLAEPGAGSVAHLEQAVEALSNAEAGVELARAHVELGAALRRAGRRTDARHPLAAGMDAALRCGSPSLANRAWDELRLAGARPRRQHLTGVESLTAAERRVAAMAAEGHTNRDIAQALFVSVKTVEGHLRNAYSKLGIEGRAGLSAHLAEGAG